MWCVCVVVCGGDHSLFCALIDALSERHAAFQQSIALTQVGRDTGGVVWVWCGVVWCGVLVCGDVLYVLCCLWQVRAAFVRGDYEQVSQQLLAALERGSTSVGKVRQGRKCVGGVTTV